MSHDIMVPLVWASTVTSYVDISALFTSVCRSKTLSHFTIIRMQVWIQICVAQWAKNIHIVTGPDSVNVKSLLVLVRAKGVRLSTGYWLCKIKRSGSLRNEIVNYKSFCDAFFETKLTFMSIKPRLHLPYN